MHLTVNTIDRHFYPKQLTIYIFISSANPLKKPKIHVGATEKHKVIAYG